MHRRQPLPRLWLMTDERQGEALWTALERLPRGAGIVFRHYGLEERERRALFLRVRRISSRRRLVLIVSRAHWRADGVHNAATRRSRFGLRTASAHALREIRSAERAGADLIFLSPVFPTRSHPGTRTLGRLQFTSLAGQTNVPVIALGGMNERRARGLANAYGWAAIDAWQA
jgi:thiamine-phosphate pyrophosphorylase